MQVRFNVDEFFQTENGKCWIEKGTVTKSHMVPKQLKDGFTFKEETRYVSKAIQAATVGTIATNVLL